MTQLDVYKAQLDLLVSDWVKLADDMFENLQHGSFCLWRESDECDCYLERLVELYRQMKTRQAAVIGKGAK